MRGLSCSVVLLLACGGSNGGDGDAAPDLTGATLTLEPADADVTSVDAEPAKVAYDATVTLADGTELAVTAESSFGLANSLLGGFTDATFISSGLSGGTTTVTGSYMGLSATASLTVRIDDTRNDTGTPANSADIFDAAGDDPARAPTVVYPQADTLLPPNLGDFETHWTDASDNNLYEVSLESEFVRIRVFTHGTAEAAGLWQSFTPSEWSPTGNSARGAAVTLSVRGINAASPAMAGRTTVALELSEQDIDGGIYYWASVGTQPGGIYRHDMARPGQPAEPFYTTAETPMGRCVACHALSRDGTTMAVSYDGGSTAANTAQAGVIDVATRSLLTPQDGTTRWNFASFTPDASRLVTVHDGVLSLRDPNGGAVITTVPTPGYATHPDFSPTGDRLAFIVSAAPTRDWIFSQGSLVTVTYDSASDTFGPAQTLHTSVENVYYPSWSPDGQWIVFNQSTEDSYDDASAQVWVIRADGNQAPIRLDSPNITTGLTNSWARWAPFDQTLGSEQLYWLTFSSKRAFGVRLPAGQPQVWMTPFFPGRADGAQDPSRPAFRLPFQALGTNNHIAQWTEEIVEIE